MQKETHPEACFAHLPCPRQLNHVRCLLAFHDRLEPLVPHSERMRLALKHVGAHVMVDQRAGVLAARLVADNRGDQIERNPISANMVANVRLRSCVVNLAIGSLLARVNR